MKTRSRPALAVMIACALLFATAVQAKAPQGASQQATTQQVHQLLKVTGAAHLMHTMMSRMTTRLGTMMSRALPCVPASYWQDFANDKTQQGLIDKLVPIYQRHFTSQDVKGLLKFYRTPLGQKLIRSKSAIARESMSVGRRWGKTRMRQMLAKLKQEGKLDSNGKCPAPKSQKSLGGE